MVLIKRLLLIFYGPPIFVYIILAPAFCGRKRGFRGWYWRALKAACERLLWAFSVRVEISDEDRQALIDDNDSVFVANHRSHLDGFALMAAIPAEKWVTFAAKKEISQNFLLRLGFTSAGTVTIDREDGRAAMAGLSEAVSGMPRRRSLILFPEGTRTGGDGLGAFKAGAVVVARESGRKIRPICISNSDALLPRDGRLPKPGVIRVDVLQPLVPDPTTDIAADLARLETAMGEAFARGTARSAARAD